MPFILEGLVTTRNADQSVNLAPMGPIVDQGEVDQGIGQLTLRPFRTSHTYANLVRQPAGVFHTSDNVELLVRAAIDRWDQPFEFLPEAPVPGLILADACQWFAFEVCRMDDREDRVRFECRVTARGRNRDFLGFNRAQHAVLEGAILVTRIGILPADQIHSEFRRLGVIVEKTAGEREYRAWQLLIEHLQEKRGS